MPNTFPNRPRILRGAFVEYGLSVPPLAVVFQFNPVQLTRSRSVSYTGPNEVIVCQADSETAQEKQQRTIVRPGSLRDLHQKEANPSAIQKDQHVRFAEESLSFELRLDATDKLNGGDPLAATFGVGPQLATLELMLQPKDEGVLGPQLGYSFSNMTQPPLILFIWGRYRVLLVNITNMTITEQEFSVDLNPIRATVAVNLTVIEGKNPFYQYTKAMTEARSALNLANLRDVANVVIPG